MFCRLPTHLDCLLDCLESILLAAHFRQTIGEGDEEQGTTLIEYCRKVWREALTNSNGLLNCLYTILRKVHFTQTMGEYVKRPGKLQIEYHRAVFRELPI